mmetsp:Transcript_117592/g.379531  ORF Transcript_117592/g.379531 Transcript_117592/m.379531 type:complete len:922 (+) Transcript_117592:74-2839(+)
MFLRILALVMLLHATPVLGRRHNDALGTYNAGALEEEKPNKKGGKKNHGKTKKQTKGKSNKPVLPAISLEDLAAHNRDVNDLRRALERYRKRAAAALSEQPMRCCCKDGTDCALLRGQRLAWSTNPLKLGEAVCPKADGYRRWNHPNIGGKDATLPEVCQEERRKLTTFPADFAEAAESARNNLVLARVALHPATFAQYKARDSVVREHLSQAVKLAADALDRLRTIQVMTPDERAVQDLAELAQALLAGAASRAARLLTPVVKDAAPVAKDAEAEAEARPEEPAPHPISLPPENATAEQELELLRALVAADDKEPSNALAWEAVEKQFLGTGVGRRLPRWIKGLKGVQTKLYSLSMGVLASPPKKGKGDEEEAPKSAWARRWYVMREAMQFLPWPLDAAEEPIATPVICESGYIIGGQVAQMPWILGGKDVMHTFMSFSGTSKERCTGIAAKMVEAFPKLSPRGANRQDLKAYEELLKKAGELGCQHLELWGRSGPKMQHGLKERLSALPRLEFALQKQREGSHRGLKAFADVHRVTIEAKEKSPRRLMKGAEKSVIEELTNWVLHTTVKYSAREAGDHGEVAKGVLKSLARTPPATTASVLSNDYWQQLDGLGVPSPFGSALCKGAAATDDLKCGNWTEDVKGYWEFARVVGPTLEAVTAAFEAAFQEMSPKDVPILAMTPALYSAAGFDSPGVIDNGDWECEHQKAVCHVHPQCGRLAAQMLAYPFNSGAKKYASSSFDKVKTYIKSKGTFDRHGFHSECHAPGLAYCWSYTTCLAEMMKWLCADAATAGHCCPNAKVAAACREDVNGEDCNVCVPPATTGKDFKAPTLEPSKLPAESVEWLQGGAEDAEDATGCEPCRALQKIGVDKPIWLMVAGEGFCQEDEAACLELCGLSEDADEFDQCKGWQETCASMGCMSS